MEKLLKLLMTRKSISKLIIKGESMGEEGEQKPVVTQNNVGMGILCYLGILVLIPFLTDAKNDPFVKFHIKQGLVLLIVSVIAGAISWIPFIGLAIGIAVFVIFIIGIVNVVNNKQEPLPIIGQYADKFNI